MKAINVKTKYGTFTIYKDKINIESGAMIARLHNGAAIIGPRPYYSRGAYGNRSRGDIFSHNRWNEVRHLCKMQGYEIIETAYPEKRISKIKQALAENYINKLDTKAISDLQLICTSKKEVRSALKKEMQGILKKSCPKTFSLNETAVKPYAEQLKEYETNLAALLSGKLTHLKVNGTTQALADKNGNILVNAQKIDTPLDAYLVPRVKRGMNVYQYQLEKLASKKSTKQKISFLPLNVLSAANLKLEKTKVIDRGEPLVGTFYQKEYKKGPRKKRHFTGALLIENNSQQFLFDLDQREVEHGIFNPFLAKLPTKCKTIDEAYKSLKPKEVIEAQAAGLEVKRQGEFFFINTNKKLSVKTTKEKLGAHGCISIQTNDTFLDITDTKVLFKLNEFNSWGWSSEANFTRLEIRLGNGRPNHALALPSTPQQFAALAAHFLSDGHLPDFLKKHALNADSFAQLKNGIDTAQLMHYYRVESAKLLGLDPTKHYCVGTVTHSGREHAPLDLGTTAEINNTTGQRDTERIASMDALKNASADSHVKLELAIWQIVPNSSVGNFTITGDID